MLQRSAGRMGATLGLTTGWTVRAALERRGVRMTPGVEYLQIDDAGLHCRIDGDEHVLEADTIIVCAGQEPENVLAEALNPSGLEIAVVGGAKEAVGLDAFRAIQEGRQAALAL